MCKLKVKPADGQGFQNMQVFSDYRISVTSPRRSSELSSGYKISTT